MRYTIKNSTKNILEIIIILFITIQGCKSNSTPVEVQPPKDPRTYTWTSDTLSYTGSAQTLMNSIWGSSKKDVYVVGHNDRGDGNMFHFDGTKWSSIDLSTNRGGMIPGAKDLRAIYGFSSNNIYAVGEHLQNNPNPTPNFLLTSLIIHYNGTAWTEVTLPSVGGWLNTVYGTSSSNVWAGGADALYHFDGSKWTRDSISVIVPQGSFFQYNSISYANNNFFAIGYTTDNALGIFTQYFFKEQSSNFMSVDTFQITNPGSNIKFGNTLWASKNGTLYSVGHKGVYKYNGTAWVNIFNTTFFLSGIYGTDENNIFAVGHLGQAYHFNGTDWQDITSKLNEDPGTLYQSVWSDGTEAFIIEQPQTGFPQKTVIWHGK